MVSLVAVRETIDQYCLQEVNVCDETEELFVLWWLEKWFMNTVYVSFD